MATADKSRVDEILAQMESLEIALKDLTGTASRTNPHLYATMAEGPREHLRRLRQELEALVGGDETGRLERKIRAVVARPAAAGRCLGSGFSEAMKQMVVAAHPLAVVLFGSCAEERAVAGSDVDLMVIAETDDSVALAERLYTAWYDVQRSHPDLPPVDILVFTPAEYRRELRVGFPAHQATLHGKVIYGRIPERH